jgi:hypothetical protein
VRTWTPEALRAELEERLPEGETDLVVPYAVAGKAIVKAHNAVRWQRTRRSKIDALIEAMFSARHFGLEYRPGETLSADETLRRGGGNCMSLASVFVGLARGIGMPAYFVDVSGFVDDELRQSGDVVVRAGHITGVVETGTGAVALDLGLHLRPYGLHRRLDDIEATGHYYNNRAHDVLMRAHAARGPVPWSEVAREFLNAIRVDPEMALAWNNLGVALARQGKNEEALLSYEMAARLDERIASPELNAGLLLLGEGRADQAVVVLREALRRDETSTRARYHLAVALAQSGQIEEALRVAAPLGSSPRERLLVTRLEGKRRYYERSRGGR